MASDQRTVRVAIIGSGLAGLTAAHLLQTTQEDDGERSGVRWEVHLLEKNDQLGMDAASLSVKTAEGGTARIDVPMRSINGGSHSRVKGLYDRLGVPLLESEFGYSFSTLLSSASSAQAPTPSLSRPASPPRPLSPANEDSIPSTPLPPYEETAASRSSPSSSKPALPRPRQRTHLLYSGHSGLSWPPLPFPSQITSLPSRLSHLLRSALLTLSYLYLLLLAFLYVSLGLSRPAPLAAASPLANARRRVVQHFTVAAEPLDVWSARRRFPREMRELLRVLMGAVATVGREDAGKLPVGEILEYITSTFASPHYLTAPSFGVRGVVAALVKPLPPSNVHLGVSISRIEPSPSGGYTLVYATKEGGEERMEVEHVVFATQADQAALLLSSLVASTPSSSSPSSPTPAARAKERLLAALRSFTYARTLVVTHTDTSVLPPAEGDRRDLNLAVFDDAAAVEAATRMKKSEKREKEHEDEQDDDDEEGDVLPPSSVQTTHILPQSHSFCPASSSSPSLGTDKRPLVLQTTNPLVPIDPDQVLSKTWFSRAVVNAQSQAVVPLFTAFPSSPAAGPASLQGLSLSSGGKGPSSQPGALWFVGSYLAPGIPLLEGCVTSAEGVVAALRVREIGSSGGGKR
ncbi:hypothetical protein JCM8097_006783 [Rhodosporidiobolus ruineniae]